MRVPGRYREKPVLPTDAFDRRSFRSKRSSSRPGEKRISKGRRA